MDNKPLETEALSQVKASLSRYNFKFAEMNFDENGGDLYVIKQIDSISNTTTKILRAQSKGRNITLDKSNVVIPQKYVTKDFVTFVYVKKEDTDQVEVFLYTAEDIKQSWKKSNEIYELYLPKNFYNRKENKQYLFSGNKKRADILYELIKEYGLEINSSDISNVSETSFYFKMWQKTGGLPPFEYIHALFTIDTYLFDSVMNNSAQYILFLCAAVIVNIDIADPSLFIDWAFLSLKELHNNKSFNNYGRGKQYCPNQVFTYNTLVEEVLSCDQIMGLHLIIGDKEEKIDAWIMRNGDYGVVYTKK